MSHPCVAVAMPSIQIQWPLSTSSHINILEMAAVQHALSAFAHQLRDASSLRIVVDNTSVAWSVATGKTNSDLKAEFLSNTAALLRRVPARLTIEYIASKSNPADAISRIDLAQGPDVQTSDGVGAPASVGFASSTPS